jgi:hypothetical protein
MVSDLNNLYSKINTNIHLNPEKVEAGYFGITEVSSKNNQSNPRYTNKSRQILTLQETEAAILQMHRVKLNRPKFYRIMAEDLERKSGMVGQNLGVNQRVKILGILADFGMGQSWKLGKVEFF